MILHADTSSQQLNKPTFQLPFISLNGSVLYDCCTVTKVLWGGPDAIWFDVVSAGYILQLMLTERNQSNDDMRVNSFLYYNPLLQQSNTE